MDTFLTVTSSHYWCEGCQIGGTAIDLYQRMTGLSYGVAMSRLAWRDSTSA